MAYTPLPSITTEAFLQKIISEEGFPMVTVIDSLGNAKNVPCEDFGDMVQKLKEEDAGSANVYHACGSFIERKSRKATNVKSMKSFYFDIDCGEEKSAQGKGYIDQDEARSALKKFCNDQTLPHPMIVDSGGGLHVYWALKTPISKEIWQGIADKLKALTKAASFLVDQSRTADAASVLRPIGQMNRKYDPPRVVCLLSDAATVDFEDFKSVVEQKFDAMPKSVPRQFSAKQTAVTGKCATNQDLASAVNPRGYTLAELEEALCHIDPWCPRPKWMSIGLALADAFGEAARDLFIRWSRGELQGEPK
jgi:hypothetical protein